MKTPCSNPTSAGGAALALRLENAQKGLITDNRALESKFARITALPLKLWFQQEPHRLERLSGVFQEISPEMTFGEAAAVLYRGYSEERQAGRPGTLYIDGMWLLLSPLIDIDWNMVKLQSGGGYFWGRRK